MNDEETSRCPEGWDASQLLAYLDGELDETSERALADHLSRCAVCSRELRGLQAMNALLETFPDAFHPDAQELYLFAARSHDPENPIASHLAACRQCREEVNLLRQMIETGAEPGPRRPPIPASLRARLASLYPLPSVPRREHKSALDRLASRFKFSLRPPVLALGTAAALVIMSVLLIHVWRGQLDISRTVALHPPAEAPSGEGEISAPRGDNLALGVPPRGPQASEHRLDEEPAQSVSKLPAPPTLHRESKFDRARETDVADTEKIAPRAKRSLAGAEPQRKYEERRAEQADSGQTLHSRAGKERKSGAHGSEKGLVAVPAPPRPAVPGAVPLKVLITAPEGLEIPTTGLMPPGATPTRYEIVEIERKTMVPAALKGRGDERPLPDFVKEEVPSGGYLVLITVQRSGNEYDLDGKLFGPGAGLKKTVQEERIDSRNLKDGISRVISSLLALP